MRPTGNPGHVHVNSSPSGTTNAVRVPWWEALKGILVPTIVWKRDYLTTVVAIAGTKI